MKSGIHMTKDKLKVITDRLRQLPNAKVYVGIPAANASRQPDAGEKSPLNNAEIGYIMETGAPEVNIPARAFLVPGIRNVQPRIEGYLKQAGDYALKGDKAGVLRALHAAGAAGQAGAQNKITMGPFDPLAPATLAARRARGRTGTRPLIDTNQLRRAITYVVEG